MMGEEIERREPNFSTHKFQFLQRTAGNMHSPSGMATPPLQTLASVPFKWEEEPGKPRPCTDIIALPEPPSKRLELELELQLPPCRMLFMEPTNKVTKTPSPTAVLDGPYNVGRPKFYSFRFFREAKSSFDSSSSEISPESSDVDVLLGKKSGTTTGQKTRWFLGRKLKLKSGRKGASACGGGFGYFSQPYTTSGFESTDERCSRRVIVEGKMRRSGSFSGVSQATSTHLWAAVYQSLKQVIPWKRNGKSRKDGSV